MNRDQMETTFGGPVTFGRPRRSAGIAWFSPEKHLWCASCNRTHPNGIYRNVAGRKTCPYADCEGDVDGQGQGWSVVKRLRPNYPVTPWMAVQYPYDGIALVAPAATAPGAFDRTSIFGGEGGA
jgi:hypothetical protein